MGTEGGNEASHIGHILSCIDWPCIGEVQAERNSLLSSCKLTLIKSLWIEGLTSSSGHQGSTNSTPVSVNVGWVETLDSKEV